jgi:hypothetical protein
MKKWCFSIIIAMFFTVSIFGMSGDLKKEEVAIKKLVIKSYVKGIFNGNSEAIAIGFHKNCDSIGYFHNDIRKKPIKFWIDNFRKNSGPVMKDVNYKFKSVVVNKKSASVVINIYCKKKHMYTGYLVLFKLNKGWKIVSKVVDTINYIAPNTRKFANLRVSSKDVSKYVGTYRLKEGFVFRVVQKGNRLFVVTVGKKPMEIFSEGNHTFFSKMIGTTFTFKKDKTGNFSRMVNKYGDKEYKGTKVKRIDDFINKKRKAIELKELVAGPFETKKKALLKYRGSLPKNLHAATKSTMYSSDCFDPRIWLIRENPLFLDIDILRIQKVQDKFGNPAVGFILSEKGQKIIQEYTAANKGKKIAVVVDGEIAFIPNIKTQLGKQFVLIGNFL